MPNLDEIVAARGQPLGEKYAVAVIECLTSSKSETRSAAFLLLEASVGHGAVSLESIKKATEKLKPAVQRSVGPMIAKMSKSVVVVEKADDEMKSPMIAKISKSVVVVQKADEETKILTGLTHLDHPHVSSNVPTAKHPLILTAGKHSGESSRSIIWPEYPEEPHGAVIENLKRAWAMNLPQTTAVALFPTSGIKKQDDAKSGIDMLSSALSTDRVMGTSVVGEFLDFIVKWLSYVLCSKESTTGLQELLSLINDILAYTVEIRRGFTDTEAVEFIPFLLERFCSSKVWCCIAKPTCHFQLY